MVHHNGLLTERRLWKAAEQLRKKVKQWSKCSWKPRNGTQQPLPNQNLRSHSKTSSKMNRAKFWKSQCPFTMPKTPQKKFAAWAKPCPQLLQSPSSEKKRGKGSIYLRPNCWKIVPFPVREEREQCMVQGTILGLWGWFSAETKRLRKQAAGKHFAGEIRPRNLSGSQGLPPPVPKPEDLGPSWVGAHLWEKLTSAQQGQRQARPKTVAGKRRIRQPRGNLFLAASHWRIHLCHWNASSFYRILWMSSGGGGWRHQWATVEWVSLVWSDVMSNWSFIISVLSSIFLITYAV